jgi:hypothetical protein
LPSQAARPWPRLARLPLWAREPVPQVSALRARAQASPQQELAGVLAQRLPPRAAVRHQARVRRRGQAQRQVLPPASVSAAPTAPPRRRLAAGPVRLSLALPVLWARWVSQEREYAPRASRFFRFLAGRLVARRRARRWVQLQPLASQPWAPQQQGRRPSAQPPAVQPRETDLRLKPDLPCQTEARCPMAWVPIWRVPALPWRMLARVPPMPALRLRKDR